MVLSLEIKHRGVNSWVQTQSSIAGLTIETAAENSTAKTGQVILLIPDDLLVTEVEGTETVAVRDSVLAGVVGCEATVPEAL